MPSRNDLTYIHIYIHTYIELFPESIQTHTWNCNLIHGSTQMDSVVVSISSRARDPLCGWKQGRGLRPTLPMNRKLHLFFIINTWNQTCHPGAPFCALGVTFLCPGVTPFHAPGSLSCDQGASFCALGSTFCAYT